MKKEFRQMTAKMKTSVEAKMKILENRKLYKRLCRQLRVTTEGTQGKIALLKQQDNLAVAREMCWSSIATR